VLLHVAAILTLGDFRDMNTYSENLRKKILDAVTERRMKKGEAAHAFGMSLSSIRRYVRLAVEGKPWAPK
jgi:transposase